MSYVGIDVGGHYIKAVLINEKRILKKVKIETGRDIIKTVLQIISMISDDNVKGIGIGLPGILKNGKIVRLPNINGFENVNFGEIIKKKTGKEILLENDGNCMAWGEFIFREKLNKIVCVSVGTGIGGGIIIDGKIYTGRNYASEFGHMIIKSGGRKCSCGAEGCLEEYVSVRAIKKIARKLKLGDNLVEISKKAREGNKRARKVYEIAGKYFGIGLANISKILDPELICIGGGISNAGSIFLEPAIKELKKQTFFKVCPVKKVKFWDYSGAVGAALLFKNARKR